MAGRIITGTFQGPASSSSVVFTPGFRTRCMIIFDAYAYGWNTVHQESLVHVGFARGTDTDAQTEHAVGFGMGWDGVATFNHVARRGRRDDGPVNNIGVVFTFTNILANVTAIDSTSITIFFSLLAAVQNYYGYIIIGDDDDNTIEAGSWHTITTPASTGEQTYTNPGFEPTTLFAQSGAVVPGGETDSNPGGHWCFGWADSAGRYGCSGWFAQSNVGTSNTKRYQRGDRFIYVLNSTTGAVIAEAIFVEYTSTGYKLDWLTTPGATRSINIYAFRGLYSHAGSLTEPPTPQTSQITDLEVKPLVALFQSIGLPAVTSPQDSTRYSLGFGSNDDQYNQWQGDVDGTNYGPAGINARTVRRSSNTAVVVNATPTAKDAATVTSEMEVTALDEAGTIDLDFTSVLGTEPEILFIALGVEPPDPPPPAPGEDDLCNNPDEPLLFISVLPFNLERTWYATTDLPDNTDYWGGWKDGRVLAVSDIRRSLSGPDLDYQVGTFRFEISDDDYAIRSMITSSPAYSRWELEAYIVTPSGRRVGADPLTVATGQVDSDPTFDDAPAGMSVGFTARDRLGIAMGWTSTQQSKLPKRQLNAVTMPGITTNMIGKGAPLPWGHLTNENVIPSGFAAPIPSGISARGSFLDPNEPSPPPFWWISGYAPWYQGIAPVTGFSLTPAGVGDVPNRVFAAQVFPVDASDRVGDPTPYNLGDVQATPSGAEALDVAWTPSPDAVKYYVVLAAQWFGWRIQQCIETTGNTVTFNHAFDTPDPGTGFSDGAVAIDGQFYYYDARSVVGGARSGWTSEVYPGVLPEVFGASPILPNGKIRPLRLYWQSTGIDFEVRKRAAGPFAPLIFTALPSQIEGGLMYWDDDFSNAGGVTEPAEGERPAGRVKGMYVRDTDVNGETMQECVIAGAAIKDIDNWYYDPGGAAADVEVNQGDGTDFLIPKAGTAWDAVFPVRYRDIVGTDGITRRYTTFFAKGVKGQLLASGQSIMSFDLQGIERMGDCTGELIEDLHDQTMHELNYFVLASGEGYTTGVYGLPPMQGLLQLPVVASGTFNALKAMREAELSGGYVAAGITGMNGELIDVSTWLKRRSVSGDFRMGPNRKWQIAAYALNENTSPLFITTELTDVYDIQTRTFKPQPRMNELANVFQYRAQRDINLAWSIDTSYTNEDSVEQWNVRKQGQDLDFYYIDDPSVVAAVLGKHARRRANAPVYITLETGLCQMNSSFDLGSYFNLTHWRGIANGGWENRVMWVLSHTFIPMVARRVRLECLDVTDLIASDNPLLLEGTMDIDLGGARSQVVSITGDPETINAYEYRDRMFQWEVFPTGTILTARLYGAVPSGVSMTAHIYDPENAVVVGTDPTPFVSADFELHTFQLPSPTVNTTYRLRAEVTGGSGQTVALFGSLRPTLP